MVKEYEGSKVLKKPLHVSGEGKVIQTEMEAKKTLSDTKEDVTDKIQNTKEEVSDKKVDINNKIQEVKEGASNKKDEIQEDLGKAKDEFTEKKKNLEKESDEAGMTPAEKVLNDIVSKFRQGTEQINEAISDYTTDSDTSKKPKVALKPLVDVLETNDTIILKADISGVKKEDIEIGISKNSVEITAMFKEEPDMEDAKFTQKERSYGKTYRKILLSKEVKVKEAKAKYKKCTLTITIPKTIEDVTKVNIDD